MLRPRLKIVFTAAHHAQKRRAAFPGGAFAQLVVPSRGVASDLGDGHDVQARVELAVSGPGEPVAHDITGGHLDRGGAGVGGERRRRAEPGDVPDPGEDLPGGQIPDTEQLGQGAVGGCHGGADLGGGRGDAPIRVISEGWIADQGLPEMGFTLGGLDELDDDQVRCLIAVDPDQTVHAITSWLPVYDHRPTTQDQPATKNPVADEAVIVGWTLDFMRRRDTAHPDSTHTDNTHADTVRAPAAFPGVMEFLIASAAQQLQDEGAGFLSLSGAPLARLDRGTAPGPLQRLLDLTGRALEPVYGFRSLLAFKAKFQPDYRPLYLLYPDPAALPAIGAAITRAYLPGLDLAQSVSLIRRLRRR